MMRKIKELLKNKAKLLDFFNLFLGLFLMTGLFFYGMTKGVTWLYLAIFSGGAMNIANGYRLYGQKAKKNAGMSMMLLGGVILFIGFYFMM